MVNALFTTVQQSIAGGKGGLANIYVPADGRYGYVNITRDYPWTVSQSVKTTMGRVILREYQVLETTIKRQYYFYLNGLQQFAAGDVDGTGDILSPYEQLYPRDKPTGFVYDMPYFSEINFEVNTDPWVALDSVEAFKKATGGIAGAIDKIPGANKFTGVIDDIFKLAESGTMAAAVAAYPKIGISDRPRLWQSHDPRSIRIVFPLYNTLAPDDWKKNRLLCELLVNQNLYNKRDFITSIPPVYYEVLVIGQHYSYASCVTNLTIYNRGNVRLLRNDDGSLCNVPDVYEIDITLLDMVIPSKNQFQSVQNQNITASIFQGADQTITDIEAGAANTVQGFAQTILNRAPNYPLPNPSQTIPSPVPPQTTRPRITPQPGD